MCPKRANSLGKLISTRDNMLAAAPNNHNPNGNTNLRLPTDVVWRKIMNVYHEKSTTTTIEQIQINKHNTILTMNNGASNDYLFQFLD